MSSCSSPPTFLMVTSCPLSPEFSRNYCLIPEYLIQCRQRIRRANLLVLDFKVAYMNIICDSVVEKPGVCPVYDEAGICPSCGQAMREIKVYCADELVLKGDTVSTYYGGRTVCNTPLTVIQKNAQPFCVGFCDACYRAEKETEKGNKEPSPAKWIAGAVFAVAGAAVIIRSMILNEHEVNTLLAIGFFAFALGLFGFFRELSVYRKDLKYCREMASDDQKSKPASDSLIVTALNASPERKENGKVYLTERDVLRNNQKKANP